MPMARTPGNESNRPQFLGVLGLLPMATDDFFRARLDTMIDLRHPLAVLATRMPWTEIEAALAPAFAHRDRAGRLVEGADLFGPTVQLAGAGVSHAGRPRLPLRLMVSLLYLKHAFNLSDEELVERWSENVVWQFFSGMTYYEPRLPCDATQLGRLRRVLGEAGVEQLLKSTIEAAVEMEERPRHEPLLVEGQRRRRAARGAVRSRLQHPLAAARDRASGAARPSVGPERADAVPRGCRGSGRRGIWARRKGLAALARRRRRPSLSPATGVDVNFAGPTT